VVDCAYGEMQGALYAATARHFCVDNMNVFLFDVCVRISRK